MSNEQTKRQLAMDRALEGLQDINNRLLLFGNALSNVEMSNERLSRLYNFTALIEDITSIQEDLADLITLASGWRMLANLNDVDVPDN